MARRVHSFSAAFIEGVTFELGAEELSAARPRGPRDVVLANAADSEQAIVPGFVSV